MVQLTLRRLIILIFLAQNHTEKTLKILTQHVLCVCVFEIAALFLNATCVHPNVKLTANIQNRPEVMELAPISQQELLCQCKPLLNWTGLTNSEWRAHQ